MSEPEIRDARREDLPVILAMLADDKLSVDREGGADDAVARAFDEIETDPRTRMLVLVLDGAVVGCGQLTVVPGLARRGLKRAIIEAVRVASSLRGRGLGGTFIRGLVALAREAGCGVVQLTSDKRRDDAHRFYRGLGFKQSHEGFKLELDT